MVPECSAVIMQVILEVACNIGKQQLQYNFFFLHVIDLQQMGGLVNSSQ